nr:T9SS type A sorting domain-containing protein [Bacteroidota bacterium]
MLRYPFLITLLIITTPLVAQNLLTDPSFEDYYGCPNSNGQLDSLKHWFTVAESPDYFNVCAAGTIAGIPLNQAGMQFPNMGNGYIGLFTTCQSNLNYREIVAQNLLQPLSIGSQYCFSVFINYAGQYTSFCSSNNLGVKFFTANPKLMNFNDIMNNYCQWKMDTILVDSANWIQYKFSFIADSNYSYIALGNFYDDLNTSFQLLDTNITNKCCSYFFIDDVCLSTDSNQCFNVGFNNYNYSIVNDLVAFPNPSADVFNLIAKKNIREIEIYNLQGQIISNQFQILKKENNKITIQRIDKFLQGVFIAKVKIEGYYISKLISLTN